MIRTIVRPACWIRKISSDRIKPKFELRLKCHDCEDCPCAWEDRSYEGECSDCGCVAYHDLYGDKLLCQMPDIVKRAVRCLHDRKTEKAMSHEYDGMAEWFMETERKDTAMLKALQAAIPDAGADYLTAARIRSEYEEILRETEAENAV